MTVQPPRPFDPRELKPGRFWYVIAAVIIAVGVAAGITVFVLGLSSTVRDLPSMDTTFPPGQTTTVDLPDGTQWAIYVDHRGDSLPSGLDCSAESAAGEAATIATPSSTFTSGDGEHHWQLAFEVTLPEPGEYAFTCTSAAETGDFAVGEPVDVGGFVGGIFGSIGALLGIPCFSIVVGGVIILVVALKRSGHKKRLQRPL